MGCSHTHSLAIPYVFTHCSLVFLWPIYFMFPFNFPSSTSSFHHPATSNPSSLTHSSSCEFFAPQSLLIISPRLISPLLWWFFLTVSIRSIGLVFALGFTFVVPRGGAAASLGFPVVNLSNHGLFPCMYTFSFSSPFLRCPKRRCCCKSRVSRCEFFKSRSISLYAHIFFFFSVSFIISWPTSCLPLMKYHATSHIQLVLEISTA